MLDKAKWKLSDGTGLEDLIDLDMREVSLSVMSDAELYRVEMEKIFAKTWLMLGHESEIPKVGDYVVRTMGEDQVIVSRDRDGKVYVSLNVCPHRGMHVCTSEAGNAMIHRCIYHGWAFRPNGDFVGAPIEREQMHGSLRTKQELGLKKARVALYGGLIFATFNDKGPSFEEFLGEMKFYYDMLFARTANGLELLGPPQRLIIDANWKTAGEQSACDGFHTLTLHRSLLEVGYMGAPEGTLDEAAPGMYGVNVSSTTGHALRCIPGETTFQMLVGKPFADLTTDERLDTLPPPGLTRGMLPELKRRMSPGQIKILAECPPLVGGMFPNVNLLFLHVPQRDGTMGAALVLHTIVPRNPQQFEWVTYFFAEKDAPPEMKRLMLASATQGTGTSGMIEQDDSDTWPHQTQAARGAVGRTETLKYQAILGVNKPKDWPGGALVYDGFTKDDAQWNWWLGYHALMSA